MRRITGAEFDRFKSGASCGVHRHANAYVAFAVDGAYEEFGLEGRFQVRAGMAVFHPIYHAHANRFGTSEGKVLNLPVAARDADLIGYRILPESAGLDWRSPREASLDTLLDLVAPVPPLAAPGWLERFVRALLDTATVAQAARMSGVTPEHAIRVCKRWFGMTPTALRREARLHQAIRALRAGASPAEAACRCGFSDQPHLTRVLKGALGVTPRQLPDAEINPVQDRLVIGV